MAKTKKAPVEDKKRAALYIRVSTHHQLDRDSLPFQRQELTNYAKYALGIDDIEIFEDAGYSGKNTERPAYQRMMKGVMIKYFTHVLVWKIDRISRNLIDFTKMYEDLKKYDVIFISKNEQFDTSSAMGEAMLKIILVFAELERKLTAERVTSIMYSRAEKGLWNGAPIPTGYMWSEENKYPVINQEEAATIRLIFDKYEELKTSFGVANYLSKNHIYTRHGNEWNTNTLRKIIRNPFYKGTYRYNYRTATGTLKPIAEQIVHHNNHDAIISDEQWQRCNEIMDSNATKVVGKFQHQTNAIHMFASLIKCGECNNSFGSKRDRRRTDGYEPTIYRCISHNTKTGCSNKYVSDVTLGPFMFNYISNFLIVQRKFTEGLSLSEPEIESMLLRGHIFKDIAGIKPDGISNTYRVYTTGAEYNPESESDDNSAESEALQDEKKKYERAFERLQNLYLFSDEAMSEKDYLVRKKGIEDKLDDVNERIHANYEKSKNDNGMIDLDFSHNITLLFISNELARDRRFALDYKKLIIQYDKQTLKDVVNAIVKQIIISDGRVSSVLLKNGLVHEFIYKED